MYDIINIVDTKTPVFCQSLMLTARQRVTFYSISILKVMDIFFLLDRIAALN